MVSLQKHTLYDQLHRLNTKTETPPACVPKLFSVIKNFHFVILFLALGRHLNEKNYWTRKQSFVSFLRDTL